MPEQIKIGIIGDYQPDSRTHLATNAAIQHAADALGVTADAQWLATPMLDTETAQTLRPFHALWCASGSPYQSMNGALQAIRFAREANVPFIGTCGGFQHVVIEYARNVLGFVDAQHAEYDPTASTLFVSALSCSLGIFIRRVQLRSSIIVNLGSIPNINSCCTKGVCVLSVTIRPTSHASLNCLTIVFFWRHFLCRKCDPHRPIPTR